MPLLNKISTLLRPIVRISAAALAIFFCAVIPSYAQQAQMVALALKTADAISKAHETQVIVGDFWSPTDKLTKLGQNLADQFSAELAGLGEFQVQDRVRLHKAIEQYSLSPLALRDIDIAAWMAKQSGAKAIILGNVESVNGQYKLTVGIYTVENEKNLGNFGVTMPAGPNWELLFQTPVEETTGTGVHDEGGAGGYSAPKCEYCPNPRYSGTAFQHRIQGVVILNVIIGTDGHAHEMVVTKNLGFGLDESAVKALNDWRFKPASGPDGKPTAVRMLVEVNFQWH